MGKRGVGKEELEYRKRINKHKQAVYVAHPTSPMEGFEFCDTADYIPKEENKAPIDERSKKSFKNSILKPLTVFTKHMVKMMRSRAESFKALEPYLQELDEHGKLLPPEISHMTTFPNTDIWNELTSLAWDKYRVKIGFTEVPEQFIFKGKSILFKYALVCIQEMDEERMSDAPSIPATDEVISVYKTLGIAVNEIADWLRDNYMIRCQSNHPLGGLTNTSPLAAKAGMGWQGCNGLVITPWYGQRHRIAPIFIEEPIFEFTDNLEHTWIEDFCKSCGKCMRSCPAHAILPEKKIAEENVPGIGQTRTCIDREKCYSYFNATFGCGKCISVCPFSKGENRYYELKKFMEKRINTQATNNIS